MKEADEDEIFDLFSKVVDGNLSEEEGVRLDVFVSQDAEIRRLYLEYTHQHACLRRQVAPQESPPEGNGITSRVEGCRICSALIPFLLGLVACFLFLGIGYFLKGRMIPSEVEPIIATLVKAGNCTWGASSLPTTEGANLTRGELNLLSGHAVIQMTSGAKIDLEAPSKIELVSPMNCVFLEGRIVTKVPPKAIGFVVETESARITDQGTEFGVFVDPSQKSTWVGVFEGIVDVEQHSTGEIRRLLSQQSCYVNSEKFEVGEAETFNPGQQSNRHFGFTSTTVKITNKEGMGRDSFISAGRVIPVGVSPILQVKNGRAKTVRKAYVAFDLNRIQGKKVKKSRVQLQVIRSKMGYATWVPDATFAVYGITDQALDNWGVKTLTWENAPANEPATGNLDRTKARFLGSFEVSQGQFDSLVSVEGEQLTDFLNEDSNGIASFIVVRETMELHGGGLIHAFAGRSNPEGVPPTLLMEVE